MQTREKEETIMEAKIKLFEKKLNELYVRKTEKANQAYAGEYLEFYRQEFEEKLTTDELMEIAFIIANTLGSHGLQTFRDNFNKQQLKRLIEWMDEGLNKTILCWCVLDKIHYLQKTAGTLSGIPNINIYDYVRLMCEKRNYALTEKERIYLIILHPGFLNEPDFQSAFTDAVKNIDIYENERLVYFIAYHYNRELIPKSVKPFCNEIKKISQSKFKEGSKTESVLCGHGLTKRQILYLNASLVNPDDYPRVYQYACNEFSCYSILKDFNTPFRDEEKKVIRRYLEVDEDKKQEFFLDTPERRTLEAIASGLNNESDFDMPDKCHIEDDDNWIFIASLFEAKIFPLRINNEKHKMWFDIFKRKHSKRWNAAPLGTKLHLLITAYDKEPEKCLQLLNKLNLKELSYKYTILKDIELYEKCRENKFIDYPSESESDLCLSLLYMNKSRLYVQEVLVCHSLGYNTGHIYHGIDRVIRAYEWRWHEIHARNNITEALSEIVRISDSAYLHDFFLVLLDSVFNEFAPMFNQFIYALIKWDYWYRTGNNYADCYSFALTDFLSVEEIVELAQILFEEGKQDLAVKYWVEMDPAKYGEIFTTKSYTQEYQKLLELNDFKNKVKLFLSDFSLSPSKTCGNIYTYFDMRYVEQRSLVYETLKGPLQLYLNEIYENKGLLPYMKAVVDLSDNLDVEEPILDAARKITKHIDENGVIVNDV